MYITILKTYIHTCHNNDIYIICIYQARHARQAGKAPSKK